MYITENLDRLLKFKKIQYQRRCRYDLIADEYTGFLLFGDDYMRENIKDQNEYQIVVDFCSRNHIEIEEISESNFVYYGFKNWEQVIDLTISNVCMQTNPCTHGGTVKLKDGSEIGCKFLDAEDIVHWFLSRNLPVPDHFHYLIPGEES